MSTKGIIKTPKIKEYFKIITSKFKTFDKNGETRIIKIITKVNNIIWTKPLVVKIALIFPCLSNDFLP